MGVSGTWPLVLREEHKLTVFDKRELRRISGADKGSNNRIDKITC
jgi:hypothetical protein